MRTDRQLFITATDTGVGKTLVSGLLLGYLRKQGIRAAYQKWVATGCGPTVEDLARVVKLAGGESDPLPLELQVPYRFPFAASPHLAAARAGVEINPALIVTAYASMKEACEFLLVEGVGGPLVPLRLDLLLADLVARLQIPSLLVARSGLGTLNHTLLALEAMRSREIPVLGVLFTDGPEEEEGIVRDNLQTIAELGRIKVFGRLPWCGSDDELRSAFNPLGMALHAALA